MRPAATIWLGSLSAASAGVAILMLLSLANYIPDVTLAEDARVASSAQEAREHIAAHLKECLPRANITPTDLLGQTTIIHSFENDVGFLATTRIECSMTRCIIRPSALIPHSAKADNCGGSKRGGSRGRKRGWSDWFSQTDQRTRVITP